LGSADPAFNPTINGEVNLIAVQPDNRILIAGSFTEVGATPRNGFARLNSDGSLDENFQPQTPFPPISLAVGSDGGILVGNRTGRVFQRLRSDGAIQSIGPDIIEDIEEEDGSRDRAGIGHILPQPDGKILLAGFFTKVNGVARTSLARLNADGTLDTDFNPVLTSDSLSIWQIAVQPDGKILVLGDFQSVDGVARNNFARLNANGTLDPEFQTVAWDVEFFAVQPDGKVLIAGDFTPGPSGVPKDGLARLNENGTLDPQFAPDLEDGLSALTVQADGRIVIAGYFRSVSGVPRDGLARLNPDGSLDTTFGASAGGSTSPPVHTLSIQTDGKILIGGKFTRVNDMPRPYLARVLGSPANEVTVGALSLQNGQPGFEITGVTLRTVTVEASTNLLDWITVQSLPAGISPIRFNDPDHTNFDRRFYRVLWQP
jgi:uncharacterized delta-60 repeat protein